MMTFARFSPGVIESVELEACTVLDVVAIEFEELAEGVDVVELVIELPVELLVELDCVVAVELVVS